MSTPAHTLSASYIALVAAGVEPTQTPLLVTALVSAAAIDIDHLYFIAKDRSVAKRGSLHKARSIFHELFGFFAIGVIMLIVSFFNQQFAMVIGIATMVHLAEDMLVGVSIPFNPIDKTEVRLLPQSMRLKIAIDITVIILFGFLWIKYLS